MNPRMLLLAGVVLCIVGYPTYVIFDQQASGGIKDRGDYFEVELKAMSNFEFPQQTGTLTDVPARWRTLDGKRVVLAGEIAPTDSVQQNGSAFELVYSVVECCFQGTPQKQHFVLVRPGAGVQLAGSPKLVRVTGVLHVKVERNEGVLTRVYSVDAERIEPK